MQGISTADLQCLHQFLPVLTPQAWLEAALDNLNTLLIDHAHCERKAAATALNLISKYPTYKELVQIMSPLAREELLHFEKVLHFINTRGITFHALPPSNYAETLHSAVAKHNNNDRLRDLLLVGAIIEARSCERFYALAMKLNDQALKQFYLSLVKSEARHFEQYLRLATLYGSNITERLNDLLSLEKELINAHDVVFRFHSGIPQ